MKETFRSLNWRKLIMVSTLLGVMFSVISISGSFIQTAFSKQDLKIQMAAGAV